MDSLSQFRMFLPRRTGPYVCHLAWTWDVGAGYFYSYSEPGRSYRKSLYHKKPARRRTGQLGVTVILDTSCSPVQGNSNSKQANLKVRLAATLHRPGAPKPPSQLTASPQGTPSVPSRKLRWKSLRGPKVPPHPSFAAPVRIHALPRSVHLVPLHTTNTPWAPTAPCQSCCSHWTPNFLSQIHEPPPSDPCWRQEPDLVFSLPVCFFLLFTSNLSNKTSSVSLWLSRIELVYLADNRYLINTHTLPLQAITIAKTYHSATTSDSPESRPDHPSGPAPSFATAKICPADSRQNPSIPILALALLPTSPTPVLLADGGATFNLAMILDR
ncbi:uncharacterized protein CLUP02_08061 [Colletotrichum lupini]|uniref:Uncharacterized protein n=1 Tax=Colletotrichum lupini TaxID=145971 RepID=A0A9Q8SS57_9PEZI|nr:uncharacterized protein CLUP02_08061 [Colletotrichum lupini]UQC82572.1 hypothetical protein CLUP02_08061 [Colletotrichum lupini]